MKEFDYIIIGGGCAGLSLAYELEINHKLKNKTLAIIEPRKKYERDKTWSFWKVFNHNFEDCIIKSWNNFTINISEKFHELNNVDFSNSVKASIIDHKFNGLNWITPNKTNKKEVLAEIENIKEVIDILKNDKENKMVITNFSFFSVILNDSQNSISRWYPGDISAFPDKNSKFFKNYRELFIKNIVNKKISSIYLLKDVDEKEITNHISSSCLNKTNISDFLVKFLINYNCLDFNR